MLSRLQGPAARIALVSFTVLLALGGCRNKDHLQMRTLSWPDGTTRAQQSYYTDLSGRDVPQGPTKFWKKNGELEAQGEWREGKPWSGKIWMPATGEPSGWGGDGEWKEYREGKEVAPANGD